MGTGVSIRKKYDAAVMIVGAGLLQLPAIRKAKEMGLRTIAVDVNPNAIGKCVADVFESVSTDDVEGALRLARKYRPDGVLTLCTDAAIKTVAAINDALGLKGLTPQTAEIVTNKFLMRKRMDAAGIPCPRFMEAVTLSQTSEAAEKIQFPFVIKPVDSSGSRGVYLVENPTELAYKFENSIGYSKIGKVIIEQFMQGQEVSVESLTCDGVTSVITVTDKLVSPPPYFVETGHTEPSRLAAKTIAEIEDTTRTVVRELGIDWSASHTEIKITPAGPRVVEIGARLGGDFITTHLVPLSTGVDMVEAVIDLSLGIPPKRDHEFHKGAAIRYFTPQPGRIEKITLPDWVLNHPAVKEFSIYTEVGSLVSTARSSEDRCGYVIVQGQDAAAAASFAEKICGDVRFVTV